jgi:hypothetical protein
MNVHSASGYLARTDVRSFHLPSQGDLLIAVQIFPRAMRVTTAPVEMRVAVGPGAVGDLLLASARRIVV